YRSHKDGRHSDWRNAQIVLPTTDELKDWDRQFPDSQQIPSLGTPDTHGLNGVVIRGYQKSDKRDSTDFHDLTWSLSFAASAYDAPLRWWLSSGVNGKDFWPTDVDDIEVLLFAIPRPQESSERVELPLSVFFR